MIMDTAGMDKGASSKGHNFETETSAATSELGRRIAELSVGVLWAVRPGMRTEELLNPLERG